MKRRGFLKKIPAIAATPFLINGIPVSLIANSQLQKLASSATNDRVLVLIQLFGGNDGLNAVIPIDQYAQYFNLRPNIAISDKGNRKYIPMDSTMAVKDQIGLHPDMVGFKDLYDQGKAAVIQGVTYPHSNGSHFRSRDIWYIGGGYEDFWGSGWMGRYLSTEFPNFPEAYPTDDFPHPPALEVGTTVSLGFHQEAGIPLAIAMNNPEQFFDLIQTTGITPPELLTGTHYWDELHWIAKIDNKSDKYAERLAEVYKNGKNTPGVNYPTIYPYNAPKGSLDNPLSSQLRMIARLISGGCKTRIYLAKMGGFDTHANQVESYDPSMGHHAALMYHLFSSVKAFQDDLKGLGLEDRVLTGTFSEFGRRVKSNGSYGTDHGAAAPMFLFGKWVKPGIVGTNPDLNNLDNGNLPLQTDYRQVYTTLLQDWLGASDEALTTTKFDGFKDKKLSLIENWPLSTNEFVNDRFKLKDCIPNPAKTTTTISFYINSPSHVTLSLLSTNGASLRKLLDERKDIGEHSVVVDISSLPTGTYLYKIQAGRLNATKKLLVVK